MENDLPNPKRPRLYSWSEDENVEEEEYFDTEWGTMDFSDLCDEPCSPPCMLKRYKGTARCKMHLGCSEPSCTKPREPNALQCHKHRLCVEPGCNTKPRGAYTKCPEHRSVKKCPHQRITKNRCIQCHPNLACEHGKFHRSCKECNKCPHGKIRRYCKVCDGSAYCPHEKPTAYCKTCGGSALCRTKGCDTVKNKKYQGYCLICCIYYHPDIPVVRNYKTKERHVVDRVKERFPNLNWLADKRIPDGCSARRADIQLDMGSHLQILEIDEDRHSAYTCVCENKRLMQLSQDVGHRPIVMLRFNPDSYKDAVTGTRVASCWHINKSGTMVVKKEKLLEWGQRLQVLFDQIQYWIDNTTTKTVEIIELFY